MFDAINFKTQFSVKNEIRVEMTIAKSVYGRTKSPVSVSDEKCQANQTHIYF